MDQEQLPSSLGEVEALIYQLYQPGAPGRIVKIQDTLQKLQRSPQGWQLANGLLENKNEQVRFFGALTFIVKLNTDSNSLRDEDVHALLQTLIGFLVKSLSDGEGALVVRKLCTALVTYFMQFSESWTRCIKHIMYCLCIDSAVAYKEVDKAPDIPTMTATISNEKAIAILWFATALVEEVGKTDSNSMKQHKFHFHVNPNIEDIVPLMSRFIADSATSTEIKPRQESLRCFQACVNYSHRAFIDDVIVLGPLQSLTNPTIMCFANNDLYEIAIEILSDILTNYSIFLQKEDFTVLYSLFNSPWAQERYQKLVLGDYEFDSIQFGMFMIAFGDANMQNFTKTIATDEHGQQLLTGLCGLLSADGFPVHEDKIFAPALEFWNNYIETVIDASYDDDGADEPWFPIARDYLTQAIQRCLQKLQFPSANEFSSWDSVDRTGFKDARRDFSDLVQQFYIVSGIEVMDYFIESAGNAISNKNWSDLEVVWFAISSYSDCIIEHESRDEYLDRVFNEATFKAFTDFGDDISTRTKNTFLIMVEAYSVYFEKKPNLLPTLLTILFEAINHAELAKTASESISTLCSSCRNALHPQLPAFLQQYSDITSNTSLDKYVKEVVIVGIAALIEAIPDDDSKISPFNRLLNFVQADVEQCLSLLCLRPSSDGTILISDTRVNRDAAALSIGLGALKCLDGIAKGSQAPSDKPVDLEESSVSSFWTSGNGAHSQQRIYFLISEMFIALGSQGEIVDVACNIWRKAFREHEPGPFVMPPQMAAQFFLTANPKTPRLGLVIKTASNIIGAHRSTKESVEVLKNLLQWVAQLLHDLGEPSNDPEVAQDGTEFLTRLIPQYLTVLFDHQPASSLEFLFMFTLNALAGSDPLPKAAAAEFWSNFVSIANPGPDIQPLMDQALKHFGPLLARALIYNIGGHAQRSELDRLSDPLKKLVVRGLGTKSWLEAALKDDSFPSDKVTSTEKSVFLQKIMSLRGAKTTNQIVRDFWLACRGSNFAYVS